MEQLFLFDRRGDGDGPAEDVSDAAPAAANEAALLTLQAPRDTGLHINSPSFCCTLPNGKVVVASEKRLIAVSAEGKMIKQPPKVPSFAQPSGLACDKAAFYVADAGTHRVHKLSLRDFSETCAAVGGPGSGPSNLTSPRGLALIGQVLYVSDCNNHRIVRLHSKLLEPSGLPFGREGSKPGELRYPHGLAVIQQPSAELVVADTQNHRLQCFTPEGVPTRTIGHYGDAPGCFEEPTDVAVAHGHIFVAERGRLHVLSLSGAPQQIIRPSPSSSAASSSETTLALAGICIDAGNRRVVTWQLPLPIYDGTFDVREGPRALFSTEAEAQGPHEIDSPYDMARWGAWIYVLDNVKCCVRTQEAQTGAVRAIVGAEGSGDGELLNPHALTILSQRGELVVADSGNHRLVCFTMVSQTLPLLVFSRNIGAEGRLPGCFHFPRGVTTLKSALDEDLTYLVVAEQRRVQILTADGEPHQVVLLPGGGSLYGVCTTADDTRVIASDTENRCLHVLDVLPRR